MNTGSGLGRTLFVSMSVLLASCGGGGGAGGGGGDTTAPTVSSTSPARGAADLAAGTTVSVTFSEAVDCATVTGGTFTLSGGGGVPGSVTCSGTTATFSPAAALHGNTTYTATVSTGVRDVAGNALAASYSWAFSTLAARVVFAEGFADLYSVKEDGTGLAALADTLDPERMATQWISYESNTVSGLGNNPYRAPDQRPMVLGERAVYQRYQGFSPVDVFAVNLDGTQRVPLAATANEEAAFALVGDCLVYSSIDRTAFTGNVRSVRLDGSGDVAITHVTAAGNHAEALAFTGGRLIFTEPGVAGGTFISDADGANRITLWDKQAYRVIVSGTRLLLGGYEMAAVNVDGTGFVAFTPGANLSGSGSNYAPTSLMFGIVAGRVFYSSVDTGTNPFTYHLHSVKLDGTDPLVLASSTTAYPYVMEGSGGRLIVNEVAAAKIDLVSYDVAVAGSRTLLLADHQFLLLQGGRVVGFSANGDGTYEISSVNPDGVAVSTLALAARGLDDFRLVRLAGNQVVYSQAAAGGLLEGHVVNLDGSGNVALTTGVAGDKELVDVVNGRLVFQAHTAGDVSAARNLHGVLLDGTGALDYGTTTADERYLGQFDAGTKLLFASTSGGTVELKVVPAAGGVPVSLQSSTQAKSFVGAF